ncbi:hypothetical protein K491DRAFT_19129 [Lophiostoma macrostomum CBS 122681]|uniref:Secreted protein n=1 Tax=Lophiostoma macrostomum CBS 122681 TaxID=1314788 RepID=A0A6A6TM84_9PLEO|nr:hypothetical protein K491DRAFT_19129 [Lophiostoma macrostomum CBS 122681]
MGGWTDTKNTIFLSFLFVVLVARKGLNGAETTRVCLYSETRSSVCRRQIYYQSNTKLLISLISTLWLEFGPQQVLCCKYIVCCIDRSRKGQGSNGSSISRLMGRYHRTVKRFSAQLLYLPEQF